MGTHCYRDHTIIIEQDSDPQNPQLEWDNLGTAFFWHKRHRFWSSTGMEDAGVHDPNEFKQWAKRERALWVKVYMMDHSGLTLRTTSELFSQCDPQGWDWGLLGYYAVTRDRVLQEYGSKIVTAPVRRFAYRVLKNEIETLSQYLEGDVWCYRIETPAGQDVSGCCGFFGVEDALQEAKGEVDFLCERKEV